MNCYDEQLRQLQAQCARKKKLEAAAAELRDQRDTYTVRAHELEQILQKEQADVDQLECGSLTAFFYNVIGKMDEKLTKEKQEAYAAQVRYNAVARELTGIESDLRKCETELATLFDCESRYATVLKEKAQALKNAGGMTAEEILKLEERSAYLESQQQELREAIHAGQVARKAADNVLSSLNRAEGWGTWDLFGGGLMSDMIKHSHLDDAQASVEFLQSQLRRFKTELADVTITANFQVNVDGFLRVADYLFDGFFADWAVLERIHHSQDQVQNTKDQICSVLEYLQALTDQTAAEKADIQRKTEQLVGSAPM